MTTKQAELLKDMNKALTHEFDFGTIGKKSHYTTHEASKLISLNADPFYQIINDGVCTVPQYDKLTEIAGRQPKQKRYEISFYQANKWIEQYSKKTTGLKCMIGGKIYA